MQRLAHETAKITTPPLPATAATSRVRALTRHATHTKQARKSHFGFASGSFDAPTAYASPGGAGYSGSYQRRNQREGGGVYFMGRRLAVEDRYDDSSASYYDSGLDSGTEDEDMSLDSEVSVGLKAGQTNSTVTATRTPPPPPPPHRASISTTAARRARTYSRARLPRSMSTIEATGFDFELYICGGCGHWH